jgi:LmbE family N-acetylglucosaminyl deacetylase
VNEQNFPDLQPKVVLGVAAHPDDLDFGAGGTMARFAEQGADVYYLILTDGSAGSADREISPVELVRLREAEQREAVRIIGGKDVEFLGYPDGRLEVTMDVKRSIVKAIRRVKPDVLVIMDPSMLYSAKRGFINHPDHRAASQAALDAVFPLSRDHLSFPDLIAEGLEPHVTPTVLLINFDEQNFFVDITATFDKKRAALAAHASQIPGMPGVEDAMKQIAEDSGVMAGAAMAEAFIRIDIAI